MKRLMKQLCLWTLILAMVLSIPASAFAQVNHKDLTKDKAEIINKKSVTPAKLENGQTAAALIKNPDQPAIYTLRTDYKVQRGDKYVVNYQPYIASVGAAATQAEKDKVNKTITLPDLAGYEKPEDDYLIDYDTVKNAADDKGKTGNNTNGIRYKAKKDFRYKAKANEITIKHVFQDLHDFSKYTNPNGKVGEDGELLTTQNGNTGSTMEVSPLGEKDSRRKGFVPEAPSITMQVPENAENFILEYRYNRAHYDVNFDSKGGTPIPNRSLYYEQVIPKIDDKSIPTKVGCDFLGWMPSVKLEITGGKIYEADKIITDSDGNAIIDLNNLIYEKDEHGNLIYEDLKDPITGANIKDPVTGKNKKSSKPKTTKSAEPIDLKMPADKITFTAVWKNKPKADYAIQFWVEKADHVDDASLQEKYEYMGTRVYKDAATGFQPNLDNESPGPVEITVDGTKKTLPGLRFPDLDQARLEKIWNGEKFYGGKYLLLNKFFVYNKDLTDEQNKDPKNPTVVKSVSATGKTVYNIYFDRQVYDLYFTKSNVLGEKETFYPSIYVPDGDGGAKEAGGPGNPYHYSARFNQLMLGWPNDAMQTKGFDEGKQSYGWGPNYGVPNWPLHLDTPPYRLNADEFLDMPNYDNWGGYVDHIDKGNGSYIDVKNDPRYKDAPYKALSFGIKQEDGSMPHHMDFWMDGFKPEETIIRYDLYRSKADTNSLTYGHRYSRVQGFTPYGSAIEEGSEEHGRITEDDIDALNEEREGITPLPDKEYMNMFGFNTTVGQMNFIKAFLNNADEFGDPLDGVTPFKENGYIRFKYHRNKYPLRFNYDPSKIKGDNEFGSTNQLDTFYEFPLKVLNPDLVDGSLDRKKREYFKEDPKNLLDNPNNLKQLGLTDLVFTDPIDGKLKVKRPDNLSDQMVFKGWALDPAGTKLIWENPKETMPTHPVHLFAKWGEPDYKWKVTFDPDGGKLKTIKEEELTKESKTIQEGDIGQEKVKTYPIKEANEGDKQVFTVIQRQKLVEPKFVPEKKGYDFMGWEVIHFKKNDKGDYTDDVDTSYRDTYKVPELYSFGNDVVSPIYLKAIWVPNQRVDIDVFHYYLDKDYNLDKSIEQNPEPDKLESKRANYMVATTGDRQDDKFFLASHKELDAHKDTDAYGIYKEYNDRTGLNNSFFQTFRVEPEKIVDTEATEKQGKEVLKDNPKAKNNVFKFFYRPFRTRVYKVNYIDEKFKGKETEKDAAIIDQELVKNGNRHYDARNYRQIPGWKLVGDPQQQLFFDVEEDTNKLLGINGTGKDEITFYYKDVRVIEVPNKDDPVPDGYVRVTFKADKGGSFGKDKDGNDIKELYYDVIKGLKSDLLPVPEELKDGEGKVADKYYVTPETGKKFIKWDEKPLLNKNTIVENDTKDFYVFTAKFEWSGLTASGLVRTEAFKDPNGTWTNDFAPTVEQLKKQLVWREKDQVKDLPAGTVIKLFDEAGNELTTDDQVYDLVNEKKAADKDELVRIVNVKAKVTFKDGKDPQELDIPITVYKNVYEALNKEGDKPLFLKEAEGKEAKDGGLKDVTGNYVKVTVQPTEKNTNKDAKVYYVNPKAWVIIPEVEWSEADKDKYDFLKWTADKKDQNEKKEENGIFDFLKRHKFTDKETLIKPIFTKDVVEQKQGEDKPKVPDNFVKVIVKTTDKATTELTQTFWVNPTKEVTIPVTDPVGKENQKFTFDGLGEKDVNYIFKEWQKVQTGETDDSLTDVTPAVKIGLAKNKYTDKVTVIEAAYKKSILPGKIEEPLKTTKLDTPQGKTIEDKDLIKQITPQEGKEIESIEVISKPDGNTVGNEPAKVIVKYKDGTTQGTNDNPVVIPVEVHEKLIPEKTPGQKPEGALDNYVKVIFKAGTGGSLSGDTVYYVSPEVEVDMTASAKAIEKTPDVGYFVNGEKWTNKDNKALKGTFADAETEFVFNFDKDKDIVVKTDDPKQEIPKGYVKVTFKTEDENKGKLEGEKVVKIYYVNPKAEITLKVLGKNETATEKQLAVPETAPVANYEFDKWYEEIDQSTPITSERIHVAKFKLAKVTLNYDAGGGKGTVPGKVEVDHGTTVRLAGPGNLAKANATFAGWKIGDKIHQTADEVTLNENTIATAQWTTNSHKVSFNTMRGSLVPTQTVEHGKTATEPTTKPTLAGKVFMGWKVKETDTTYFDFTTPITADKTLIAIWQEPVQKINDGDKVEEQFIKVTFKQGDHGQLVPDKDKQDVKKDTVTYKVAKDLNFADAQAKGLVVPEIAPAKYYKAKDANGGWDKALDLTLAAGETEKVFTAQYEPIADVIPIDPKVTPDNKLQDDKPEGMVLVEFVVDGEKAFMETTSKFYVAANKEVTLKAPTVYNRTVQDRFKGWENISLNNEGFLVSTFTEDTTILAKGLGLVEIKIYEPKAGSEYVFVEKESLVDGATGKLEIVRGNESHTVEAQEFITERKLGRRTIKQVRFGFKMPDEIGKLQSGDVIRHWSEKGSLKSKVTEITIK